MYKKKDKKGYISIEIIIIMAIMFITGLLIMGKWMRPGSDTLDKEEGAYKDAMSHVITGGGGGSYIPTDPNPWPDGGGEPEDTKSYMLADGRTINERLKEVDSINKIKSIEFIDTYPTSFPITQIHNIAGNNGVYAWYSVDSTDNMAKVYFSTFKRGQKVVANPDSAYMLSGIAMYDEIPYLYLNLQNLDTSKVEDMRGMFNYTGYRAKSFIIEGLETWDTSNVTDMTRMFMCVCGKSESCNIGNISQWNTINVKRTGYQNGSDYGGIFMSTGIREFDLSGWDLRNSNSNDNMFQEYNQYKEDFYQSIKLPKNIKTGTGPIVSGTWYDLNDNNKMFINDIPYSSSSHHIVRITP